MQKDDVCFKTILKEAKERMKSGYWTDIVERRNSDLNEAEEKGADTECVNDYYKKLIKYDDMQRKLSEEDRLFYQKVCEILDNDACVLNPIELLVDKKYLESLDYNERQRYMMKVGEKFRKFSEIYRDEKNLLNKKDK